MHGLDLGAPPRPSEAKNGKSAILLILMVVLKVCGWRVSARGKISEMNLVSKVLQALECIMIG